ncbi:hypothetical protein [Mycobacterium sp.]|uniref:hypothetical protein n=1 Tax=Mycobacterium sp. TaxID=1785 RepID=UPI003C78D34B
MSTPTAVRALIDALADDIYDAYYEVERSGPQYDGERMVAARYLARRLLRNGWQRSDASALPRCPYGTVTCYDPEPHEHCQV